MTATQSSPVDSVGPFYPLHQRDEAAKSLPPMESIDMPEFYRLIGEPPPESPQGAAKREARRIRRGTQQPLPARKPFKKLRTFLRVLESCLEDLDNNKLKFEKRGSQAPSGHPLGSWARPDIAIFREGFKLNHDQDKVFWGSIELAIEFHSKKKSHEQRIKQAATYVLCLLEARPDLVSGVGLLVESDHLDFFFCNADGIKRLSLRDEDKYLQVLSAVVEYLNAGQTKNLDSTLCRVSGDVHFDVSVPEEGSSPRVSEIQYTTFKKCTLHYSHDPFGRRPNIFKTEPGNPVHVARVIKDQYIRKGRRWTEKEILDKIHANGTYPAVVRMCFAGTIPEAGCGDRIRVRIALQDHGTDFMSLKTPRDVIYALYDLLEITRSLYSDRKILHRDISPWNIMVREAGDDIPATDSSSSPVFIRHILNPQVPKHKSSIFLIDFGYSQDLESSKASRDGRTGTPMFIARAVQAGKPLPVDEDSFFPALPHLSEQIRPVYENIHPQRMKSFDGAYKPQYGPCENPVTSPFRHELRHDAESGVWTLFWWGILASPENAKESPVDPTDWSAFAPRYRGPRVGLPNIDKRDTILNNFRPANDTFLHPGYGDLLGLFSRIAKAIRPDYYWAGDPIRRKPDFVHEILQRIILNFVVENNNTPAMDTKKSDSNRAPLPTSSVAYLSQSDIDSRRAKSFKSSASSRKRKSEETTPISAQSAPSVADDDTTSDNPSNTLEHPDDNDTQRLHKRPRMSDIPEINLETE